MNAPTKIDAAQVAKIDNCLLWDKVERTDPAHTKQITGKSYKGTSPSPYYLIRKATEVFGPCGLGWGFNIVEESIEDGLGGEKVHLAKVRVWYKWLGERGEVEHVGGTPFAGTRSTGKTYIDEDANKKSVTDALVKALSLIGFAGDIFIGRYDDSKYVAEIRQEIAEEGRVEPPPAPEPPKQVSAADPVTGEIGPRKIAREEGNGNLAAWGGLFKAGVATSRDHAELIRWSTLNDEMLGVVKDHPKGAKLYKSIMGAINEVSQKLPPLTEQKLLPPPAKDTPKSGTKRLNLNDSAIVEHGLLEKLKKCLTDADIEAWAKGKDEVFATLHDVVQAKLNEAEDIARYRIGTANRPESVEEVK